MAMSTKQARRVGALALLCVSCGGREPSASVPGPAAVHADTIDGIPLADAQAIITGFGQGAANNCASIAPIKAAMVRFGPDHIFRSADAMPDGTRHIVMQDGQEVVVTAADVDDAMNDAKFTEEGDAALKAKAYVAMAAIARRMMSGSADYVTGCKDDGSYVHARDPPKVTLRSVKQALCVLNDDGMYFMSVRPLLGIEASSHEMPGGALTRFLAERRELKKGTACVAASKGHAWFVSHGVADRYGSPIDMFALANEFGRAGGLRAANGYCMTWPM